MAVTDVADIRIDLPEGFLFARRWTPDTIKSDEPLILIHDSLGSVEQWRAFPERLAEVLTRPVMAYDRLGFGQSSARSKLPSIHFIEEEATHYFPHIYQALGLNNFSLFGHSVGGAMALNIAAQYPNQCKAVVTESAQAFVEDRTRDGIQKAKISFENEEHLAKLRKWHSEKAEWVLKAWTDVWLSKEFSNWQLKPALGKVASPTLIIHGENDEFGSQAFPNLIESNVKGPAAKKYLSEIGHVPHRENPELILKLVSHFFAKFQI
ncbi:alpha/beta fold hydrolase [Bdellovibrio sp. HCB274]|uniref:alpha/beta fold hydrolase n=1 Tax=Bdellovibrio sp. HCB274 TaxID=3394361 RepID=UPI0039B39DF5